MRHRCFHMLFALAALLSVPATRASAQDVRVERRGQMVRAADAGAAFSAAFQVSNAGRRRIQAAPSVTLPRGWRLMLPEEQLALAPGESEMRVVAIVVPPRTPAGTYAVRYAVGVASDSALVQVRAIEAARAEVDSAPVFAVTDSSYVATFTVANTGNATSALRTRVRSTHGLPAVASDTLLSLAPGASREVRVHVSTRLPRGRQLGTRLSHRVDLEVTTAPGGSVLARTSSTVPLFPKPSEPGSQLHVVPTKVGVLYLPSSSSFSALEVRGSGTLLDGGATKVRFDILHPLPSQRGIRGSAGLAGVNGAQPVQWLPLVGETSRYIVGLAGRAWSMTAGDQYHSLTPMTQSGFPAFGATAHARVGAFGAAVTTLRDRRAESGREEQGGSLIGRIGRGELGASWLERRGPLDSGNVLTLHGSLALPFGAAVRGEYGVAGAEHGQAVSLQRSGSRVVLALQHAEGSAGFPGILRDRLQQGASASLRVWSALRVHGDASRSEGAPDTLIGVLMPRDASVRGGISLGSAFSAEVFERSADGRLGGSAVQEGGRIRLQWRRRAVTVGGTAEHGSTSGARSESGRTGASRPLDRYLLNAALRHGAHYLSINAEHSPNALGTTLQLRPSTGVNAVLHVEPAQGSRMDVSLFARRTANDVLPDHVHAEIRLEQQVAGSHVVTLRARHTFAGISARRTELLIGLGTSLGLPVGLRRTAGNVIVIARDPESGRPLDGLVVRLGDRIGITGSDGRAIFTEVAPGSHTLDADAGSLGPGWVSSRTLPTSVEARGGRTEEIEVPLLRGATVEADVRLMPGDSAPPGASLERSELAPVVVTLANGERTVRRRTDSRGRVRFTNLVPGRWIMTVAREELPAHHRLEKDSMTFDVGPDEVRRVELGVVPVVRRVIVVAEEQELSLDGSSRPAPAAQSRPSVTIPKAPSVDVAQARPTNATAARNASVPPKSESHVATPPKAAHYYIVVSSADRHMADVARWVYGDARLWPRIWAANRAIVPDPAALKPGMRLLVPPKGPLTASEEALRRRHEASATR